MTELRRKAKGIGLSRLCGLFGRTRQAFYDHRRRASIEALEGEIVLEMVHEIHKQNPRMGARKLYALT